MLKTTKNVLAVFALVLIFISASFAQQPNSGITQKSDDDFVTEKGFKSKVFEVKYRDVDSLAKVLRSLGSGFKGASISPNSEFKTLTVRDFPENLATIEEALKRLDTPGVPRPNIELHMYVLIASNTGGNSGGTTAPQVPAELKDVLTQLRETLSYRNYELATTVVQRLTETSRGLRGKGTTQISGSPPAGGSVNLPYEYLINSVTLASPSTGASIIQIGEFSFSTGLTSTTLDNRTQVQTALNLRDGEKVVVGTTTLGDRALIIVLTAKLVN